MLPSKKVDQPRQLFSAKQKSTYLVCGLTCAFSLRRTLEDPAPHIASERFASRSLGVLSPFRRRVT
jgi:hypothetical protein